MIQSERACSQFPSAYTTRAYVLRLSCDHAGSDPSQHKVKLGYAQTYLDDKRLAMDIHFFISLQTKPTFLFKAEISPHSVNWVS